MAERETSSDRSGVVDSKYRIDFDQFFTVLDESSNTDVLQIFSDLGFEEVHEGMVKVLALTDHDTMSGITEAVETDRGYGIKIIPGVEISTIFSSRNSEMEEPVHILAYYSSCGPMRYEELENLLATIREVRYLRAKDMVLKLNKLKLPLKWEHVTKIAGNGVAPGRLHVARAMVEAGYVENLKQAFAKYLYDGGPAYSTESEPPAEEAVQLICQTAYNDLADTYDLLKLGGSDYHGRGGLYLFVHRSSDEQSFSSSHEKEEKRKSSTKQKSSVVEVSPMIESSDASTSRKGRCVVEFCYGAHEVQDDLINELRFF